MAITQQDILEQIPRVILTSNHEYMESSYDVLIILRSLVCREWPSSKLYGKLNELVKLSYLEKTETAFVFDKETLTYAPRVCDKCDDLGDVFNFLDDSDHKKYPCPKCTPAKRGELGQIVDALKVYKKELGVEVILTDINQSIKNLLDKTSFCVSVEIRIFKVLTEITLKKRPLALLNFAEWDLQPLPECELVFDEIPF